MINIVLVDNIIIQLILDKSTNKERESDGIKIAFPINRVCKSMIYCHFPNNVNNIYIRTYF